MGISEQLIVTEEVAKMAWNSKKRTGNASVQQSTEYNDIEYALARVLLNRQIYGEGSLTYAECAEILTRLLGRPVHAHGSLRMPLYHVAGLCNELDLPFLSTLVTLKYQPKNARAGEGFYKMACEFKPEYKSMDPVDVWEIERGRLEQCKDWSKLDYRLVKAGW